MQAQQYKMITNHTIGNVLHDVLKILKVHVTFELRIGLSERVSYERRVP